MRRGFTSLLLAILLVGCSSAPVDTHWTAAELRDYRFDFERSCFCPPEVVEPVRITVRRGAVREVRSRRTGRILRTSSIVPWFTLAELLEQVREAEAEGTLTRVEHHPRGYPELVEIGDLAADAGVRYRVDRVEPLR